jgi:hypothetical protein
MFSYHHWDDDENPLEDDGNNWSWFYVSMYDMFTEDPIANPWPVFAEGYQQAMDIYEILYKDAVNRTGDLD